MYTKILYVTVKAQISVIMGWEQLLTEADNWLSLLHLSVLIHNDIIITLDSIAESLGVVGYQLNPIVWVQHLGGEGSGFFRSKNPSVWFYIRTISISFHKICTFHFFKIYNNRIVPIFKCKVGIFKTFLWYHRGRKSVCLEVLCSIMPPFPPSVVHMRKNVGSGYFAKEARDH